MKKISITLRYQPQIQMNAPGCHLRASCTPFITPITYGSPNSPHTTHETHYPLFEPWLKNKYVVCTRACSNICCCIMFVQQTFPNQMSHMGSSAKNREAGRGVCVEVVYFIPLCHITASQQQDRRKLEVGIRFLFPLPPQSGGGFFFNARPDGNSFFAP